MGAQLHKAKKKWQLTKLDCLVFCKTLPRENTSCERLLAAVNAGNENFTPLKTFAIVIYSEFSQCLTKPRSKPF